MNEHDGTFREILVKILDTAEDSAKEQKHSERRIMTALEDQRREIRGEFQALEQRVRDLEIGAGVSDERVKGVAGRVGGVVALLTSGLLLLASYIVNHWPGR